MTYGYDDALDYHSDALNSLSTWHVGLAQDIENLAKARDARGAHRALVLSDRIAIKRTGDGEVVQSTFRPAKAAQQIARNLRPLMEAAPTIYFSKEAMARTEGLTYDHTPTIQDVLFPSGFAVFAEPVEVTAYADGGGFNANLRAVLWFPLREAPSIIDARTRGDRDVLAGFYNHLEDERVVVIGLRDPGVTSVINPFSGKPLGAETADGLSEDDLKLLDRWALDEFGHVAAEGKRDITETHRRLLATLEGRERRLWGRVVQDSLGIFTLGVPVQPAEFDGDPGSEDPALHPNAFRLVMRIWHALAEREARVATVEPDSRPAKRMAKRAGLKSGDVNVIYLRGEKKRLGLDGSGVKHGSPRRHKVRGFWRKQPYGPRGAGQWRWTYIDGFERGKGPLVETDNIWVKK